MKSKKSNPPIILIDTREQRPVLFDKVGDPDFPDFTYEFASLKTGDYSIKSMSTPDCQHSICIERKSLEDLFQTLGRGRKRFERELSRMAEFDYSEIVIEGDLKAIFQDPPPITQMRPKSVYRSLIALSQRYGVSVWPCPNRSFASKHIYLTLMRFWQDRQPGGKMEFSKI
jgi:ERCC4-type nuclease